MIRSCLKNDILVVFVTQHVSTLSDLLSCLLRLSAFASHLFVGCLFAGGLIGSLVGCLLVSCLFVDCLFAGSLFVDCLFAGCLFLGRLFASRLFTSSLCSLLLLSYSLFSGSVSLLLCRYLLQTVELLSIQFIEFRIDVLDRIFGSWYNDVLTAGC